jgi:hypothetical protein
MPRHQATLVRHCGYGPTHYDLIAAAGPRCPTWRMVQERGRWHWTPAAAHRRYYLHFSGPVSGNRGTVKPVWRGMLTWSRSTWKFGHWSFRRCGLRVVPHFNFRRLSD